MINKTNFSLSGWQFLPIALLVLILPSVSVTVKSGATSVFFLILLPSLFLGLKGWKELLYEEKIILWGYILFVVSVSFSFLNSSDVGSSFGSFEKYLRFLAFVPMYLFVRRYELELGSWLSLGCVIGCLVLGLVAVYQFHILGVERPDGARNAARFGLMAIILFLLLCWLMIFVWREKLFFLLSAIAIVILYAITLNQTRAAMLCIVPFILLVLCFYRCDLNKKVVLIATIVTSIFFLVFLYLNPIVGSRFNDLLLEAEAFFRDPLGNYYSDFGLRVHMYHAGLLVFSQSPVFGTGLGDYAKDVQLLMDQGKTYVKDDWLLSSPHNIYINLLAETGIVGLIGFILGVCLAPLYAYIKLSRRNQKNRRSITRLYIYSGLTCIVCYLLFGMFHTWININNSISIFLLLQLVYLSNLFSRNSN